MTWGHCNRTSGYIESPKIPAWRLYSGMIYYQHMDKQVTIYSTPTCHFCKMAKEFFAEKGIEYTNYDVASDAVKRDEMIKMTGQLGVPVIVVGGDIMVGFDRERLASKLGVAA